MDRPQRRLARVARRSTPYTTSADAGAQAPLPELAHSHPTSTASSSNSTSVASPPHPSSQILNESSIPTGVTFQGTNVAMPHASSKNEVKRKITYFENARNFSIQQPIMGEIVEIHHEKSPNVMEEMYKHIIPGAEYDSSARDSPPRCHPGTRTQILEDIQTRIDDPKLATRIIWLYGPAGVGKSAIMQTVAETVSVCRTTFTTLFFSRPNKRNDPRKTFSTLAYGLAVVNPEYRNYIGEKLKGDPAFLAKSMDEQFRRLFITPFTDRRVNTGSQRWPVLLDGLDECRGETEQCRIIDLIHNSVLQHADTIPFIWIIASRPEAHLKVPFTRVRAGITCFYDLEVPIDSVAAVRDVELFLEVQFSNIRESYPDSVPPRWPSESDFLKIALASSGLFVFSSTLIGYLRGGDPVTRLKLVLSLIEDLRTRPANLEENPFEMLDLLYTQIMKDIPQEVLSTTKLLLGFYLIESRLNLRPLKNDGKPYDPDWNGAVPLLEACNILGLERHRAYACLRKLHSVLKCPPPKEAEYRPVQFLHASFSDFLCIPSRSHAHRVDLNQELNQIWQCYTRILREYGTDREHARIRLSWLTNKHDSLNLRARILKAALQLWTPILVHLGYGFSSGSYDLSLLVDTHSLIEIFRELGPLTFAGTNGQWFPIEELLCWLNKVVAPEFQSKILCDSFLHELDTDRLFMSLCSQRWCHRISRCVDTGSVFMNIDLSPIEKFDASQWPEAKELLWGPSGVFKHLWQAISADVLVFGVEPAKTFVVIGPISLSTNAEIYYVFPYAKEC